MYVVSQKLEEWHSCLSSSSSGTLVGHCALRILVPTRCACQPPRRQTSPRECLAAAAPLPTGFWPRGRFCIQG